MKLKFGKTQKKSLEEIFQFFQKEIFFDKNELDFLIELVEYLRPDKIEHGKPISIQSFISFLEKNEHYRLQLIKYIHFIFLGRRFTIILSDTGIIKNTHFFAEIKDRIISKFLPEQPDKDTLEYVLNQVIYKQTDYIWIDRIPISELEQLAHLLEFGSIYNSFDENSPLSEILNAMSLLIQRASGRVLEQDVLLMNPEFENIESPYEAFEKELDFIHHKIENSDDHSIKSNDPNFNNLQKIYSDCHDVIDKAFLNSREFGISLSVNQSLLRIQQQLNRLGILLPFLVIDREEDKTVNSIRLALKLIRYNCKKNNVAKLIGESTQTISYEITQHTAKTGEHYITQTKTDYFKMLFTAMGGGFIVGVLCVLKILLSKAEVSDFGHAFLYSMNYSMGFILIYLMGFTLATKQPAMTAAAIVKSIESGMRNTLNEKNRHQAFAELFSQLFRSQFIAFVGNVIIAFPVSLAIVWLSVNLLDFNPVIGKEKDLLRNLSPIHSAAIFHAAIAGVFLFLSGVISGSISNRNKHKRLYYRISEHPVLKQTLGKERTKNIATWFEQKWPGVSSNFWFGIFMGSTVIIGSFLGLNLDIRHITFASGNFALGLFGSDFNVSNSIIFWSIFGIAIIGFVNFIVSFSLSLGLAFRSRNIPASEIRYLFRSVWNYFKRKPISFFFPVHIKQNGNDESDVPENN